MKIALGKSRDSRTRGKLKTPVNTEEANQIRQKTNGKHKNYINHLLQEGYGSTTIERYVKDINHIENWADKENLTLETMTYPDVMYYMQSRKTTASQKTISKQINSLKHYFDYLVDQDKRTENPVLSLTVKGIKRRKLYHILKHQELEALYKNYSIAEETTTKTGKYQPNNLTAKRNKTILGMMIWQGLSTTELHRLEEKDLKLREGKIYITGTRRSNERTLNLEAVQIMDLIEYTTKVRPELLKQTGKTTAQLFTSNGSGNKLDNALQRLLKQLQEQNPSITSLKQIRASVITHWLKNHNLRQVQYKAGHRFISSTESYLINDLEDLSEEITKYHPIG